MQLLTLFGLTLLEVSVVVYPGFFCLLDCSFFYYPRLSISKLSVYMRQTISSIVPSFIHLWKYWTGFSRMAARAILYFFKRFLVRTSRYICVIKSNLMPYLPSVYFTSKALYVSAIFVAHHKEVHCTHDSLSWWHRFLVDDPLTSLFPHCCPFFILVFPHEVRRPLVLGLLKRTCAIWTLVPWIGNILHKPFVTFQKSQ